MPRLQTILSVLALSALSSCAIPGPSTPGAYAAAPIGERSVRASNDFTFSMGLLDRTAGGFASRVYPVVATMLVDGVECLVAEVDMTRLLIFPDGTATRYLGSDGRVYWTRMRPETTRFETGASAQ